jgi:hypothetical protein
MEARSQLRHRPPKKSDSYNSLDSFTTFHQAHRSTGIIGTRQQCLTAYKLSAFRRFYGRKACEMALLQYITGTVR